MTGNISNTNAYEKYIKRLRGEIKEILPQEACELIFSDGKIDSSDVNYLNNYASSSNNQNTSEALSNISQWLDKAINKIENFINLQRLVNNSNSQNTQNTSDNNQDDIDNPLVKNLAALLNMSLDELCETASNLGFTAKEFALGLLDEISKQLGQNQEQTESNTESSSNDNPSSDSSTAATAQTTPQEATNNETEADTKNTQNTEKVDASASTQNTAAASDKATLTGAADNTEEAEETVDSLLNKIFNDPKGIKALDQEDNNGKLSDSEKNKFIEYVKNNNKEIDIEDLKKAYDNILNGKNNITTDGKLDYSKDLDGDLIEQETTNDAQASSTEDSADNTDSASDSASDSTSKSSASPKSSKTNNSSGGGNDSPSSTPSGNDTTNNTTGDSSGIDKNVSLDKLKKQKADLEKNNTIAQESFENAKLNCENNITEKKEAVGNKQKALDEAQKAYENAMNEDDYFKTPEGEELKKNIEENLKAIAEKEEEEKNKILEISNKESALIDAQNNTLTKQAELNQAEYDYTVAQNKVKTLKDIRSKIQDQITDDSGSDKLDQIQNEIIQAEIELKEAQKAKETAEKNLETAKEQEKRIENELKTASEELAEISKNLETLKTKKDEYASQVDENCNQATIQAKNNYTKAKEELDVAQDALADSVGEKVEALNKAQEPIKENREKINELDKLIKEKEAEEKSKDYDKNKEDEYGVNNDGQSIVDLARKYLGKGNQKEFGQPGAWCAAFVRYVSANSGAKILDWYNAIGNKDLCSNITKAAKAAGAVISLSEAQSGDIITFDYNHKGKGDDHVGIITKVDKENGIVYTIEGNYSDKVCEAQYRIDDPDITCCCRMT